MREPSSNGRGNLLFLTPCGCSSSFVPDPCASFLLRFSRAIGWTEPSGRTGGKKKAEGTLHRRGGEPRHWLSPIFFLQSQVRVRSSFPSTAPSVDSPFINLRRNAGLLSCGDLGGSPSRGSLLSPGLNFSVSCEEDQAFLT